MKALWRIASILLVALYLFPVAAFAQYASFTATPTLGVAPLQVQFTMTAPPGAPVGSVINFGDGTSGMLSLPNVCAGCTLQASTTHTYTAAHTYQAILLTSSSTPLAYVAIQVAASSTQQSGAPQCQLRLNTSTISIGGSVTLTWSSINATGGAITNVGNVGASGSVNLLPSSAAYTTYVGSFTGPKGTANCSATVRVTSGTGVSSSTNQVPSTTAPPTQVATTPAQSSAPSSGLVPCGYTSTLHTGVNDTPSTTDANGCQACDLATLIQSIINFIIGISIPIAAALFAYAGVLYFTSGADHHNIDKAKAVFKNAGIGFVIVITSWLVINTAMHVIFSQSQFVNGNWFTIQCSNTGRVTNGNIGTVLSKILGNGQVLNNNVSTGASFNDRFTGDTSGGSSSGPTPVCGAGSYYDSSFGDQACFNPDTGEFSNPAYTYSNSNVSNAQMSQEIANACAQYGMDSTACMLASSIANNESSGGKNCTTSPTGAAGCMQVLATTACGLDPSISDACGACLSSRQSLSAACAPVIQVVSGNTQLGTNLGVQYINQMYNQYNGSCQLAAAAYYQGPGAVQKYGGVPPAAISYVAKACR